MIEFYFLLSGDNVEHTEIGEKLCVHFIKKLWNSSLLLGPLSPLLPLFPKALLTYPTLCPILTFKNLTYSLSCLAVSSLQLTLHMLRNWLVGIFPFDALNFTILLEL